MIKLRLYHIDNYVIKSIILKCGGNKYLISLLQLNMVCKVFFLRGAKVVVILIVQIKMRRTNLYVFYTVGPHYNIFHTACLVTTKLSHKDIVPHSVSLNNYSRYFSSIQSHKRYILMKECVIEYGEMLRFI